MIKRLLEKFRRDQGLHMATVRVDFFPQDLVTPYIYWYRSQDPEGDTIPLVIFVYARILYELAELNEVRVARELMAFVQQVSDLVQAGEEAPKRPHLPLGQLKLTAEPEAPAVRTYEAEFFQLQNGQYRLEFHGSLGRESFYLPGAFLALLQSCLDHLGDEPLKKLAQRLNRLHDYYRYRRDFWDGGALSAAPVFALSKEELRPDEPGAEP